MRNQILLAVLVIISLVKGSLQDVDDNKIDTEALKDIAKQVLKKNQLGNIGGIVEGLLQNGDAKQLMDGVLQNLGKETSGQILESLGSLLNGDSSEEEAPKETKKSNKGEANPMELLSTLGSLVGAMQGAGNEGNPSGALLQGLGSLLAGGNNNDGNGNGGAALLQGLGSILASSQGKKEDDNGGAALLQGLGSILGAVNGAGNDGAAGGGAGALLQGLGSLLGGAQGNGEGGLNPELIGSVLNMFTDTQASREKAPKREKKVAGEKVKPKAPKAKKAGKSQKETPEDSYDFGNLISLASNFLGQANNGGKEANFMDYLPMIMNTLSAFTGDEAKQRADSHSDHTSALPPVLEKLHIYFDNFVNSDMGKQLMGYLKQQKAFKEFQDKNGNFDYEKFESLIENHSFRRYWIRQITEKLVDFLKVMSDKKIQDQYVNMGVTFTNSYLQSAGFPKSALIDLKKPAESLTKFANYASNKYLDASLDTKPYVEPVVLYSKELLSMAQASISSTKVSKELTEKLTDTINMEIIEPIARVNRAYRFAKSEPKCDRYVFCVINRDESNSDATLPNVRKALYKGFSLIAGWFLSSHTGTSYWDLYGVLMEGDSCKTYYNESCNGFYREEVKTTTEYVHTEL